MAEELTTLGQRVLALRKELKKTQIEMAKVVGVATATWQKIERDEGLPTGETLMQFEKLGINPGWILTGLGPRTLHGWRNTDAEAEIFMRIGSMIQEVHEQAGVELPLRSLAKTARALFEEVMETLEIEAGPDEVDAVLNLQAAKLRRQLKEAAAEPGSGKRSAS